jgi:hypothetical protein
MPRAWSLVGLLRFNGIRVPEKERPGKLAAGLERRFEGLGDPGTGVIVPTEVELFVSESRYDLWYHGGIKTGDEDLEAEARRQGTRLKFLCRKFFEDIDVLARNRPGMSDVTPIANRKAAPKSWPGRLLRRRSGCAGASPRGSQRSHVRFPRRPGRNYWLFWRCLLIGWLRRKVV